MIDTKGLKNRILTLIEAKELNKSTFERLIGASNGYVNSINESISVEKLGKILSAFPNLNLAWLLTGEGDMLKSNNQIINQGDSSGAIQINATKSKIENIGSDNRQYFSDSPDVLRATIQQQELVIREKDERIREKDERIREKDERINELKDEVGDLKKKIHQLESINK